MKRIGARLPASLTVEAAFAVPLVMFLLLLILGFFYVLQTEICVTQALSDTARKMAAAYGTVETAADSFAGLDRKQVSGEQNRAKQFLKKAVSVGTAKGMVSADLGKNGCWLDAIRGGAGGVLLSGSDTAGDYVDLKAVYVVKMPISFFGLRDLPLKVHVKARKWTGYREESEGGSNNGTVYITPYGKAYHKTTSCRYLDLSIRAVGIGEVAGLRNLDGGKYYRCSCCRSGSTQVYITNYGTEYHSDRGCRDLKRTIFQVKEGDVGSRHPCSGCCGGE
jgi:hypothetical protein